MNILSVALFTFVFFLSTNVEATQVTVTFDSLEISDNATHNLNSYTEEGLTFSGPYYPSTSGQGVFYDGQLGPAYQGSAALYVAPSYPMLIEAQPGRVFNLVSFDWATLCGDGIVNSKCQYPSNDISFRLETFAIDQSIIASDEFELTPIIDDFLTFEIPSLFNGFGVHSFEITRTGGFGLNYMQIDNLVFEPIAAPVPEPSTFLLLGAGLAGLGFVARRRRKE